jgi:hypothetical protein
LKNDFIKIEKTTTQLLEKQEEEKEEGNKRMTTRINNKKHSTIQQLKRSSKSSYYLSLRNIIKPIALRPSEYETYLLTNFLNMTLKTNNETDEMIKNTLECSTSNDDFKSSSISLPLIDNKFVTDSNRNDICRFKRLSVSNSTETTFDLNLKKNRLNSPSLLISSQNFIKKKRRLDLDYDTRPYINLQKMKSKLYQEKNQISSHNDCDDFIDEGIDSENQSAYSSSSSFYSNSSYNTIDSISNDKNDSILLNEDNNNNNNKSSFSSHNYSNIKFIDIDLNQIEND